MRDMFRNAADAAYSLLGFGNPEADNPETIKRNYLGEGVTPQSVNTLEEIWAKAQDADFSDAIAEFKRNKKSVPVMFPVTFTTTDAANTIMHEMILGSHDQFRNFIQLFLANDPEGVRRFTLFYTLIYGGIYPNGDYNEALAANRPIELAINEMLNIEHPEEERAEIRRNLGYLLAHFMRYEQEDTNENNPTLLEKLQRFINGEDDEYQVSEEARDRCLYHISSIWADIHEQDPGYNGNIDGYRYEGQDRDFLTILRDSQEADQREVLQYLLPDGYEIPEGPHSIPLDIQWLYDQDIQGVMDDNIPDENVRYMLGCEAVRQSTKHLHGSSLIRFFLHKKLKDAASMGYTNVVRLLLYMDAVKAGAHRSDNIILREADTNGYIEIVDHLLEIPSVRNAQDGERIYQERRNACANIPLDRAHRSAEDLAGHAQGIAEPHRQTGEDGNDREHNIRQDSSL